MSKKMELIHSTTRLDLSIEKDAGNVVCILMGGKTKKNIRDNWIKLRNLCNDAINYIEFKSIPEN